MAATDAPTLLLHNYHAIGAEIHQVTKRFSENGVKDAALNASKVMETLGTNAQALTEAILRLQQV
ncbi:hypothetical protein N8H74_04815 [Pseudomonas sp. B2M1-30]|uniref:Uncharacterized protein n=1 Tax=Pseudomonas koreensis TaxID=198620 RepID=A0A9X3B1G5_9PSED|nr:hypothetical protein [Pseudomonas sp. B2M1-30]MCU7247022.1 hypothetical protein [Pseudomonas koreensis]MCU7259098.1 hypothetical protein [Pseudomonas koreensis]